MDIAKLKKQDIECLSSCFLFKDVGMDTIMRLVKDDMCELAVFKKGDVIFDISDFRRSIGFVLTGGIAVTKDSGGRRYVMNTLSAGSVFGVAAVFSDEPDYVTSLRASSLCRIVFIPQQLLERVMREDFVVAENYMRFLSGRIHFLNQKIETLIIAGTGQTVAHYLIANASEENGRFTVLVPGSISGMADMLNIGRASLYRSFCAMERAGLIHKNGKEIEILDLNGLAGF
ncbi:MAG: Crp/Fnr family transcriptional regulator [Oscillospiraceae bacterium]